MHLSDVQLLYVDELLRCGSWSMRGSDENACLKTVEGVMGERKDSKRAIEAPLM